MTDHQIYSMSSEFFDTSSNSSSNNPLKYDIYTLTGSSSSFGSSVVSSLPTLSINTNNYTTIAATSNSTSTSTTNTTNAIINGGSSNVMLTTAISIPRSNNPNQSHHPYQLDNTRHHLPSPSPLHSLPSLSMASSTQQQQQQHNQQQQQQQQLHQQQQQHQQQHHHHHQEQLQLNELSDFGLDALDAASLSPTLLQDVSLSAASPLSTQLYNGNSSGGGGGGGNGGHNGGYFSPELSSPLGAGQLCIGNDTSSLLDGNSGNLIVGSVGAGNPGGGGSGGVIHCTDNSNSLLFEITPNSNAMWSDISCAIINPKNEPFSLDDDYIFPNDKAEIQAAELADLNGGDFLDVIGNIEDLLPPSTVSQNMNFLLSPSTQQPPPPTTSSTSSTSVQLQSPGQASPVGPPMELLQTLPQLQTLLTQQQQQQQQQQQLQTSSSTSPYDIFHSTPNKQIQQQQQQQQQLAAFSPGSQSSHSPLPQQQQQQQLGNNSITPPPHANRSQYQLVKSRNMQELMKKGFPAMSPDRSQTSLLGQSVPNTNNMMLSGGSSALSSASSSGFGSGASAGSSNGGGGQVVVTAGAQGSVVRKSFGYQGAVESSQQSRLSSSAPTHLGLEHIWTRREPRQHLLSTGSLAEAESFSSLSTGSMLSPECVDFSQDDDDDASSDNSENFDDFSSDNGGSGDEDETRTSTPNQLSSSKGKERYFWQYNVQAKGPKGKRLVFQTKVEDPHFLNEVTDPVFSPTCSVRGIKVYKHSGKARKGDGNDLTPNARKLHNIGKELDKLSRTINDMTPVSELPFNVRPKSRKEKNKLASRACRLKKKAQHEANKIKLFGLEIEHKRLINGIAELKQALAVKHRTKSLGESTDEIDQQIQRIYNTAISGLRIAGGSTDFVNKILENMRSGHHNGGLDEIRKAAAS